ncbi:zf-TFIIB domain-containing protein [Cereibacter sphaeroides]|uniref:TFIIB-type zinc ribbon-containing protein n=1 Tax=Cereibacter sphaeroides TaxID=1063 RepID=UPI001F182E13|nr:zf-TFIIB domain-containing protein [Cereibacter sphaeroides]MCE6950657.1 zf-TFIIB domain-containing protein [Cereibacter sphaeroides]MCE6959116.1 zf-TFIIB domain-containing protein [Cereibacter sphaeroides]MCE6968357.1 zf-TFIIB domain-containing protein [Cereibacter sphaeroides]MCE6974223.1 zf-TFIIB domain-containing protein [Cereibacter sphaeroides]
MKCPIDNETLLMTERSGVEIDYCPKCRGVWLDRGELEKIIDRAMVAPAPESRQDHRPSRPQEAPVHSRERGFGHHDDHQHGRYRKRKESFLGDLFDF